MKFLTLAIALSACAAPAFFLSYPAVAEVVARDPAAYETAAGMKVGAALMGLHSDQDDALVGASSPVCERVEIHSMSEDNGVMKMRKEDRLDLPADKIVKLEPSGYHLMLIGLKAPLQAGSSFPVTLNFAKAPAQTVTVTVLSRSAETQSGGSHPDTQNSMHEEHQH